MPAFFGSRADLMRSAASVIAAIQALALSLPATGRTALSVPLGSVPPGNAVTVNNPSSGAVPLEYTV